MAMPGAKLRLGGATNSGTLLGNLAKILRIAGDHPSIWTSPVVSNTFYTG